MEIFLKRNRSNKTLIITSILILLLSNLSFSTTGSYHEPNIITVDDDKPADYNRIQDAIDNATDGDTIYVYNGYYLENIVIDKSIILKGENNKKAIIQNQNSDGDTIYLDNKNIIVSGFTIKRCFCYYPMELIAAIRVHSDNNIIENNVLKENSYAIILDKNKDNNIIRNNTFNTNDLVISAVSTKQNIIENNTIDDNYWSIELQNTFETLIVNNTVCDNYYGISLSGCNRVNITSNNFINNGFDGLDTIQSDNFTIINNTLQRSNDGIDLRFSYYKIYTLNNLFDNDSTELNRPAISILSGKNNQIYHNNFFNNSACHDYTNNNDNFWYNAELKQGNYWDEYNHYDNNCDGVGDKPYHINDKIYDLYPLKYIYPDEKSPFISITHPDNNVYFRNYILFRFLTPIVFGYHMIEVNSIDNESKMRNLTLYINDKLVSRNVGLDHKSDIVLRYGWNDICFGRYKIRVVGFDRAGNKDSDEKVVWKFI